MDHQRHTSDVAIVVNDHARACVQDYTRAIFEYEHALLANTCDNAEIHHVQIHPHDQRCSNNRNGSPA